MIEDRFQGWLVIDYERLKVAFTKLSPHYRKYKTIRKELKINPQQLTDYLEGKRYPSLLNFKKLCLYVQISADELLGLSSIEEPSIDK